MDKIQSLKGMIDLIGNKSDSKDFAESIFTTEEVLKNIFTNYGYSEIRTPALEDADLFKRSVGDSSDIVNKELYSFLDNVWPWQLCLIFFKASNRCIFLLDILNF